MTRGGKENSDVDDDIEKIVVAFRNNVPVKDRRYRLKTYKNCFVASEAVDFLLESGISASREEAVKLGQELQHMHYLFQHVTGDHLFQDEYLFFKYTRDAKKLTDPPLLSDSSRANAQWAMGLLGLRDDSEQEEQDISFAQRTRNAAIMDAGAASANSGETRKQLVMAEAEKSMRVAKMADHINKKIVLSASTMNAPFETKIKAPDMRCLALVAHNHMKPAMESFIQAHSETLKKFRLTGTNTTMTMCRSIFGEDSNVVYGPTATSGPTGGDAQLAALLCLEDIGGIIFFVDPLSPHPHQADIDSLVRLANVHNVMLSTNPTTSVALMWMMRQSLAHNKPELLPSFFETLESPSVAEHNRAGQKKALEQQHTFQN